MILGIDVELEEIMEKIRIIPNFPLSSIRKMIVDYATTAYNAGVEEGKKQIINAINNLNK